MTKQAPKCPLCGTERIWKDGLRQSKHGDMQRYICRECGYRFSETRWNGSDDPEHVQRVHREPLNTHPNLLSSRQICVTPTKGTKNLAEVESRTRNQAAGASARKPTEADTKGKIVEYAWWMKKQGYAETTIIMYTNVVGVLAKRGSNIYNPDSVKEAIAKQQWSEARKESAIAAYTLFLKMVGGHWEPPRCHPTRKIPFIPTEEEIDVLIASCGRKTSTFLQLLKETAMRLGEANSLRWIDIDLARKIITLNRPEKRSEPRIFKVSSALMDMINSLPRTSERVFGKGSCASKKSTFRKSRKRMANKLKNPGYLRQPSTLSGIGKPPCFTTKRKTSFTSRSF